MIALLLGVSVIFYVVSLFLPALHGGENAVAGWLLGMFGWAQILNAQCFAWLANPLYVAAVITSLLKRYRDSLHYSLAATFIAIDTFRATHFNPDESGRTIEVDGIGIAFYVWILSFLMVAYASWKASLANNSFKPTPLRGVGNDS
jgi:hypothetical protein